MGLKIDRVQLEILVQQNTAAQKLGELEDKMKKVRTQMTRLSRAHKKDTEEYRELEAQLKDLKLEYENLFDTIDIGKMTLMQLTSRQRELNAVIRNLDPSIPEWQKYKEMLDQVNGRIRELRGQAQQTSLSLSKITDGFNKYAGIMASALASLTGVALTARSCVDSFAEMEEAEAGVVKYTGLTKKEVEELNDEFKKMDTRTSREKLNALAGDAGRLGITSKDAILEFVDAANQINVSLGEDLGEDAVSNIGKLAMMFGEDKDKGLRGAMLATGSAINEVAQNSSSCEKYLVDFTSRVAGVANQAGVSQANIIGFAATMDENMLRSETSATAFQNILMKMFTNTEDFAKAAGLNLQEFSNLVRTDANEALLTFARALSKKGGLSDLAPIFGDLKTEGAGVASVLSVLAGKAEEVTARQKLANEAYQEAVSMTKEYTVQNNTAQASIDKAKKAFNDARVALGEELLPVMTLFISKTSLTVKGLRAIVSIFVEYKREILALATAAATYALYVNRARIATAAYNIVTKTATYLTNLFNAATKASPWGLVIAGVTAVISYFTIFSGKTKAVTADLKDMNSELEETKSLFDRIGKLELKLDNIEFLTPQQKQKMRTDLTQAISDLDEFITDYEIKTKEWYADEKAKRLKEAGDNEYLRFGYINNLNHELDERVDALQNYIQRKEKLQKQLDALPLNDLGNGGKAEPDDPDKLYKAEEEKLQQHYQSRLNTAKMALITEKSTQEEYQAEAYKAEMESLISRKALMEKYGKDTTAIQGQIYDKMIAEANRVAKEKEKAESDSQAKQLAQLEQTYLQEQSKVKQQYLDGEIATEEQYKSALLQLEKVYLGKKRDLMASFGEDTSELQKQILDKDVQAHIDAQKRKRDEMTDKLDNAKGFTEQNKVLQAMYDADLITYEEYQGEKDRIDAEHHQQRIDTAKAAFDAIDQASSAMGQVFSAMQDAEISKVTRKYDKQIKAAKKAGKDTTKLEEEKEAAINAVKKKYADKQFAAAVLQITATTAVTAMEAYKAMAGIPVVGPALGAVASAAAIAAGAAQIAVAKTQRDEAKGLMSGGYSADYIEGYTSSGNPTETAGVIPVHKNEFVANHEAVANPEVRQFLDVFDIAQRNGTIRMINTTQILEHVRTRAGRYSGGYTAEDSVQTASQNSPVQTEGRLQYVMLLQDIKSLLQTISQKELVVDSRKVRDGIKRVEQLERNVSR